MDPVKISSLELENVKRIRALELTPDENGLTVIGGRNGQGKTSVLDAIAWALGGNKMKPDNPTRDGAATPAKMHVELSNGITVERRGKNGTLYVTDTTGMKGTQKLLDEFLSALALDLPKFLLGTDKDRTTALLQTLGIDHELAVIDSAIRGTFDERRATGAEAKRLRAHADELPHHDDVPDEPVAVGNLSAQLMEAVNTNAENQRKRERAMRLASEHDALADEIAHLRQQLEQMEEGFKEEEAKVNAAADEAASLVDIDTTELRKRIENAEAVNEKVRDNERKAEAEVAAGMSEARYHQLTEDLGRLRENRVSLLAGAPLPLEGLSVNEDCALTFNGQTWSSMSSSEQLRVATAIVRATKPECGFVLVDRLEQMDPQTLREFGEWAASEGLQVIGTRVGTDDACTVIIEDGKVEGQDLDDPVAPDPRGEAIEWSIPEGSLF